MKKVSITPPSRNFRIGVGIFLFLSTLQVFFASFGLSIWFLFFIGIMVIAQLVRSLPSETFQQILPLLLFLSNLLNLFDPFLKFPLSIFFAFIYFIPSILITLLFIKLKKLPVEKWKVIITGVTIFYIISTVFSFIVNESNPDKKYRTLPEVAYENENELYMLPQTLQSLKCRNTPLDISLAWTVPENNATNVPIHTPVLAKVNSEKDITIVPRFLLSTGKAGAFAIQGAYYHTDTIVGVPDNGINPDTMIAEIAKLKKISYEDGKF